MLSDTIAAISTPLGEGGISLIRISGTKAKNLVGTIFKPSKHEEITSHRLYHGWIVDNSRQIDEVLVSYMAAPNSYTGEDVIEISCHGGTVVTKHILELVIKQGARHAGRGEFTKRAFLNGKIDLSQAEAVIYIIKARTKEAGMLAASQIKGSLSEIIKTAKKELFELLSEIEASIDFPDEIESVDQKRTLMILRQVEDGINRMIKTADIGKIYNEGISIAIIGKPNVGKSSILNALLREERSIVTDEPGTTRDVIEEVLNIKGIPVRVIDTAGVRSPLNKIESLGIERAIKALNDADMILLVIDISQKLTDEDIQLIEKTSGSRGIIVLNKTDRPNIITKESLCKDNGVLWPVVKVSALNGDGIQEIEHAIYEAVISNKVVAENMDVMINLRHKQCLLRATESIKRAIGSVTDNAQADLVSIDIRDAIASLGEVTGESVSDEVIEAIFERFCVGK